MSIKITRTNCEIAVQSPYSPALPARAKAMSGKWNRDGGVWVFPIAAEKQVADLFRDIYGEWDDETSKTVNLLCTVNERRAVTGESLTLQNRVIARAFGRDSGARTSEGVIVISGGFGSGGSVKNWQTSVQAGTKFRLLNVPVEKANILTTDTEWCDEIKIEQDESSAPVDRNALIEERTKLSRRIAEIDALLHQN